MRIRRREERAGSLLRPCLLGALSPEFRRSVYRVQGIRTLPLRVRVARGICQHLLGVPSQGRQVAADSHPLRLNNCASCEYDSWYPHSW